MANVDDEHRLNQGLNLDSEDRDVKNGQLRYALNARSGTSDKSNVGAVESMRGNQLMDDHLSSDEIEIGSCPDSKNLALIKFIYNPLHVLTFSSAAILNTVSPTTINIVAPSFPLSIGTIITVGQTGLNVFTGQVSSSLGTIYTLKLISGTPNTNAVTNIVIPNFHYIKRYFTVTGTTEYLTNPGLMGKILNFSASNKIINPKVVNSGQYQYLTWTDGVNPPRLMNIDLMKGSGAYYSIANDDQYINLKKTPPSKPPTFTYNSSGSGGYNLLNKNFQFRYRYIFSDNSYSEFSPISLLTLNPATAYDQILVSVNSGHHTVVKVEVCYREGNGQSETGTVNTSWYTFIIAVKAQLSWSDATAYNVIFTNDAALIVNVPAKIDLDKHFDTVPLLADEGEIITTEAFGDQIMLGGYTEGADNVQIDSSGSVIGYKSGDNNVPQYFFPITQTSANVVTINFTALGAHGQPLLNSILFFRIQNPINFNGDNVLIEITNNSSVSAIAALISPVIASYALFFGTGLVSCVASGNNIVITFNGAGTSPLLSAAFWGVWTSPFIVRDNITQDIIDVTQTNQKYPDLYIPSGSGHVTFFDLKWMDNGGIIQYGSWDGTIFTATKNISLNIGVSFTLNATLPSIKFIQNIYTRFEVNGVTSDVIQLVSWGPGANSGMFGGSTYVNLRIGDSLKIRCGLNNVDSGNYNVTNISCSIGGFNATAIVAKSIPQLGFKKYNKYDIGIVYQDGKLYQGAVNNAMKSVYVPGIYDDSILPTGNYIPDIKLHISNAPPDWATQFSIVVKNNELAQQVFIKSFTYDANGNLNLSVLNLQSAPSVGDYVRFVFNIEDSEQPFAPGHQRVFPVLGYNSSTGIVIGNVNAEFIASTSSIIEIFRSVSNVLYFENGQFFDIVTDVNGNKVHSGDIQNQIIGAGAQPAIVDVLGDTWYEFNLAINQYYLEETQQLQANGDNVWNQGRPQIEVPTALRLKYPNMFRWGNQLIPNTQVNGLSTWDSGNYAQCGANFGKITGLRQRGYTLRIIQETNCSSAFLGRKEVTNADGQAQLVVTDNLIGIINPDKEAYGTQYPGSIVQAGNDIFFIDTIRAAACRDAGGGIIPVSKYRANRYWWDKSELLKANPTYEVISGFDFTYNDWYVTIKGSGYTETIYFNIDENQWKSFVGLFKDSTNIDGYGCVGANFFVFMQGATWQQNVLEESGNPVYAKFFGVQQRHIVEFITNLQPGKEKVFNVHEINGSTLPVITKLSIPAGTNYTKGMYSELWAGNYVSREDSMYADIKRDANTKGIPATDADKRNWIAFGRPMRGQSMNVRMEFLTPNIVVTLLSGIAAIPSEKS